MTTCQWCGDQHGTDQLCQRAQRGMTRRSFCFLFGAGEAGAMIAPPLTFSQDLTNVVTRTHIVKADATTMIEESISGPTVATFRSSHRFEPGQRVEIHYAGQTLFAGVVEKPTIEARYFVSGAPPDVVFARSHPAPSYEDILRKHVAELAADFEARL